MRKAILIVMALFAPIFAFGQKKPKESAKVWIGMHASVRAASQYAIRFTSSQPGEADPYYAWHHNHAGLNTPVQSGNIMVHLVPGRTYTLHIGSANWRDADVHFNLPPGYSVLVGETNVTRVPKLTYRTADYNGGAGTYLVDFEIRPLDGANTLAPGYALPPTVGDVTWAISLGALPGSLSAGAIRWRSNAVSQELLDGSSLIFSDPVSQYVDVDRYPDGGVKYVGTPQVQILVTRNEGWALGYTIEVYRPWAITIDANGNYNRSETPFIRYEVSNPDATWNNRVRIVRTQYDVSTTVDTWILSQSGANTTIEEEGGQRRIRTTSTPTADGRTETVVVENSSSQVATKVTRQYRGFVWGEEIVSETLNPDAVNGPALTTQYEYYTDGWVNGAFSGGVTKLKSVRRPDGSWEKYEYYDDFARWGQLAAVYRPWKDGPSAPNAATAANSVVTRYSYVGERGVFQELPAGTETTVLGVVTNRTQVVGTNFWTIADNYGHWLFGSAKMRSEEVRAYASASSYLSTYRTVFHTGSNPDYLGKVFSQRNPDGTKMSASYVKGDFLDHSRISHAWNATTFNPNPNGWAWADTYLYGTETQQTPDSVRYTTDGMTGGAAIDPVWLIPWKSMRRQVIRNQQGFEFFELNQVFTGSGFQLVGWEYRGYSPEGILTTRHGHDASKWQISLIAGQTSYETNPDGTQTQHHFDELRRVVRTEVKGVDASGSYAAQPTVDIYYTYDVASRVIQVQATAGGISQTRTRTYNLAGALISETDERGLTTTYAYSNGGRTVTTTMPGGATQITDSYLDGSHKSTTGTGVIPSYTSRDIFTSGAESGFLLTKVFAAQDGGPRYSQVVTDWLGRKIREEKPKFGGGLFQTVYIYNAAGQLVKKAETGVAASLYQYNALGELQFTGVDMDGNDTLTLASLDRVSEVRTKIINQDGAWWSQTLNYVYGQENNGTPTLTGETLTKLVPYEYTGNSFDDGVAKSETRSYDVFRNLTVTRKVLDRPSRLVTTTTDVPDSVVDAVTVIRNGLTQSTQNMYGHTTRFKHDALWRLVEIVDPRLGSFTGGYYAANEAAGVRHQLAWVRDPANNTTSYNYDQTTGRLNLEVNPLGKTTRYSHDILGRVVRMYGAATYPVEYEFNAYGEQIKMRTFRDTSVSFAADSWPYAGYPSASDKGDYTTWNYDAATGLLLSKVDAQNRAVDYTYNARGQLLTRQWARTLPNSATRVTTTYAYDARTAEQTSITYNDGTPNLNYTYNRRGLTATVTDVTGTRTFTHCDCGKLTGEALSGFYQNREIRWILDNSTPGAKGRTIALHYGSAGNGTNEYGVSYGYDAYGRLNHVLGVNYTYTPNSNLIAAATDDSGAWTQYRSYESNRNLLSAIETKSSTVTKARFAYTHDALGRRVSKTETGEVFSSYMNQGLSTNWGYNDRSEVTSSQTVYKDTSTQVLGRGYGYSYDPIGNRLTSTQDGATSSYTANSLNQYTQRTVPGQVAATGFAPSNATVDVNGSAASRQGEYFHRSVTFNNTSAAVWAAMNVSSSLGGSTARHNLLARTPETYTYDADGNITSDGQWEYTWDAENRLIQIAVAASAYNAGRPRFAAEFKYDYLGRRVLKRVTDWNGSAWVTRSERRFLYDGWNVIGEYSTASGYSLVAHYKWGIDLAGSLQDAGGVGGLLRIYSYETGSQVVLMPAYDGNGNIYGLVDRANGALRAIYEYSPFGETLRASGDFADRNPFRYSTKYTDDETKLLYFGYRYYDVQNGRFLGRDPLSERGGINLYSFVRNGPSNRVDALGLCEIIDYEWDEQRWSVAYTRDGEAVYVLSVIRQRGRAYVNCGGGGINPPPPGGPPSDGSVGGGGGSGGGSGGGGGGGSSGPTSPPTDPTRPAQPPVNTEDPNNEPDPKICDYLRKEMNAAMKRFDGHHRMSQVRRDIMAEMGGRQSIAGEVFKAAGKDAADAFIGQAFDFGGRAEWALGGAMAYNSVNTFYEGSTNLAAGDYFNATMEIGTNAGQAAVSAGRLYGARWAARGIPGLNAVSLGYDIGSIAVKGGIAGFGAKWHNDEYNRMSSAFQDSIQGMDLELGTMDDIMDLMKENGCK
jgi:RHS repeat-associated protein